VEQVQIEELVAELETRVDRLRSLYEQYFMGIEKMEPLVPKKDVERRFQTMRKEQIRNTALRFRFHMVLQKYNTYQSYWMRIMRQIEDGTYKRDVMRARANLADRRSTRPPPPVEEKVDTAAVTRQVSFSDFPVDVDVDADYPNEAPTRKVDIPMTRERAKSASFTSEFSPFDEATTRLFVPTGVTAMSADEDPTGILPLIGGSSATAASGSSGASKGLRPPADPEKMRLLAARIKLGVNKAEPPPRVVPPAAPPTPTPAGAGTIRKPPPLPPKIRPAAGIPASPPPAPKPMAPPIPRPAVAKPPAPPPPASSGDLPADRVRQIYSQYVETKRKQNEPTTAITYEGVAKSLRESTARLKEKHGGKSVDFEVAVKDGKTILRPVVKKDPT